MAMQRQTTWMVSILTLMVVLSAYYLMTGDVRQMDVVTSDFQEGQVKTEDITKEVTQPGEAAATTEGTSATEALTVSSDFFEKYKYERDSLRQIEWTKLMDVIADAKNSEAEEIVEAQTKLDSLQSLEFTESVVEEMLSAQYGDAVVIHKEGNIQVVVQAEALTNVEVVKILDMVTQQFEVPAHRVTVSGAVN
jgi:stage III sporulation protein AH